MRNEERILEKAATVANVILAGGGLVCLSAWLYFIYNHGGIAQKGAGRIVYYVLPALFAILFLAAMRLRPSHRVNLVLCGLAVGGAIYGAELFLNFTSAGVIWGNEVQRRKSEIVKLAKRSGIEFDTRTKLEVITELRSKGIDAVPAINPPNLLKKGQRDSLISEIVINDIEILPLGGIANKLTVLCNETGEYALYNSDEHGFHNPEGIWNSTRLEIAAVGDSFTQGACVSSEKNFVSLIRGR